MKQLKVGGYLLQMRLVILEWLFYVLFSTYLSVGHIIDLSKPQFTLLYNGSVILIPMLQGCWEEQMS